MSNKYELTEHGVKDLEKGFHIPNAEGNRHWREYQEWLAEGNTPKEKKPLEPYYVWDESKQKYVEDKDLKNTYDKENKIQTLGLTGLIDLLISKGIISETDF